jgi:hypothetical protein
VCAATIAPVSSKLHILSVIAARTTADCHSNGTARLRTQASQCSRVRSRNSPTCRVDGAEERIVLAEDQRHRTGQREGDLVDDIGQRRVRRQAQDLRAADVADVIGADDDVLRRPAVVVRRPHADGDARQAGERLDAADDLRRPVLAFVAIEPRREIANADFSAMNVGEDRLDDRGVAHIARLGFARSASATSQKPFSSSPASKRENTGSESK